jgi:hypothetical protein
MSGLLLGMVVSVFTCWFHIMVTLPPRLVSTDFCTCWYQWFLSNCTPVSLHMLKCSCALTLSCLFIYCSFASIGHADMLRSIASSNYYYCYWDRDSIVYIQTKPRIIRSVVPIPEGVRPFSVLQNRKDLRPTQTPISSGNLVLVLG